MMNENTSKTFGTRQAFYLLLAFIVIGLTGQIVTFFFVQVVQGIHYVSQGLTPAEISAAVKEDDWLYTVICFYGQYLIGGYAVFWLTHRWAKSLLGLGTPYGMGLTSATNSGVIWAIGVGLFTAGVAYGLFVLFLPADVKERWMNEPLNILLQQSNYLGFATRFHLVVVTPLVEEFVFRGAIFSALSRGRGVMFASIATSTVFIILHLESFDYWLSLVAVGLMSGGLIMLRLRFGSLIPCIIAHSVYNASLLLLVFKSP